MSTTLGTRFFRAPPLDAIELLKESCADQQQVQQSLDDAADFTASVQRENEIRSTIARNVIYLVLINGVSSMLVFLVYLISIESLISIGLSIGLTVYAYQQTEDRLDFDGSIMSWTLLSFAVIVPTSTAIGMAFTRRDSALYNIASLRATLLQLYTAHSIWNWNLTPGDSVNTGRHKSKIDWNTHSDQVLCEIFGICVDVTRYLNLPHSSRGRHHFFPQGRREAERVRSVAKEIMKSIILRHARMAAYAEVLKREGLPGNESNRVRQWEQFSLDYIQKLRMIKTYRTPQALRSFARLFSAFLPPFYAPYYAQMGRDLNSLGTAIAFAVITSLALTSLFETVYQMEDPFVTLCALDGVHTERQLIAEFAPELVLLRQSYFPNAEIFQDFPDVVSKDARVPHIIMFGDKTL